VRRQYAGLGRQIIDRAFERAGRVFDDDKLRAALPRLARPTQEDVYAAVGRAEMDSHTVLKALYPDYVAEVAVPIRKQAQRQTRERGWFGFRKNTSLVFRAPDGAIDTNAIPIRGLTSDLPVRFAPNGGAVPGDRIVGILEPGEGITIYPIHAKALAAFDETPERWLDVRWDVDPEAPSRFPTQIKVTVINEPGVMAEITKIIAEHNANIDNLKVIKHSQDIQDLVIDIEVFDLLQLNAILSEARQKKNVTKADRSGS
jgi:GTP pyrophosphokinase